MATEPNPVWVANSTVPYADQDYQDGDRGGSDAVKFYELAFSGDTPLHQSQGTAYNGNGYINFLGNGAGSGHGTTNIDTVDITDDPLFPGTIKGLQDTYFGGGTNYTFGNQTLFIFYDVVPKFYMRLRCKWSSNWEWGDDQLKFCKNKGDDPLGVLLK